MQFRQIDKDGEKIMTQPSPFLKYSALALTSLFAAMLSSGCAQQSTVTLQPNDSDLVRQARNVLIAAASDPSPLIRSHAIESLADADQRSAASYVLQGLNDEYWGVRFTACMAVLEMHFRAAKPQLEKLVHADPNKSVQAAAAGALHVMGDKRYTNTLGSTLFDRDVIVRRNTAMVLGRIGDPQACTLLKSAMVRDSDMSVKLQAVEAMTLLGNEWAQKLMINNCRSVFDDECILAILALGRAKVEAAGDTIAYVYDRSNDPGRLGMKLVAARALAMLEDYRGKTVAVESLNYRRGDTKKAATIRQLSAMVLAEIKDKSTLPALTAAMNDSDPDVRIAASLAILKTAQDSLPF
jgi:HEAT repeat protein